MEIRGPGPRWAGQEFGCCEDPEGVGRRPGEEGPAAGAEGAQEAGPAP